MDVTTIVGLIAGVGLILLGQKMEGGHASSIMALSPILIVLGGTIGAVMVGAPGKEVLSSLKALKLAFGSHKSESPAKLIERITEMAKTARRDGLLALDTHVEEMPSDFMKSATRYLVDGVDSAVLREILEAQIAKKEEHFNTDAKFWEAAGGYSPTIGIIGAVLGLIHTMENLDDPSKIGAGIATAFVATVYGVALANLVFLPFAAKIKRKAAHIVEIDELIMEGILAVQAGHNSHVIEARLQMYAGKAKRAAKAGEAGGAAGKQLASDNG